MSINRKKDIQIQIDRVDPICTFVNKMKVNMKAMRERIDVIESNHKKSDQIIEYKPCKFCVELETKFNDKLKKLESYKVMVENQLKIMKEDNLCKVQKEKELRLKKNFHHNTTEIQKHQNPLKEINHLISKVVKYDELQKELKCPEKTAKKEMDKDDHIKKIKQELCRVTS